MVRTPNTRGLTAACFVLLFAAAALAPSPAVAQPDLTLKRVVNNWPTIELYFQVTCDGDPEYFFNKEQHFKVFENGVEVGEFTLWCPDPRARCPISVALVFDASLSMGGAPWTAAKEAGKHFVTLMDGQTDEAALLSFNAQVYVDLSMTTNKMLLTNTIDGMQLALWTLLWDGLYAGVQELQSSSTNPCRAVIVLTDGGDTGSQRTPQEIIALANRNRIRVFGIGLGNVQEAELETIAELTGGRYYRAPGLDELNSIYEEISTILFEGFQECLITYQSECLDGSIRNVELQLQNFCNGVDVDTKTFRAPRDTSTFEPLEIVLDSVGSKGNREATLPLRLKTPIDPMNTINASVFTVMFDPACVQFKSIETKPGHILHGQPILVNPIAGGVELQFEEAVQWQGTGTFAELRFLLSDPDDTTCCPVELSAWDFEAGCFKPVLIDGEICILPRSPEMQCSLLNVPNQLVWVRSAKDYQPNPIQIEARAFNTGDKDATNARFTIDADPAAIQLILPLGNSQPGSPKDVPPGESTAAGWSLRALPRLVGDSVEICITASFDNHEDIVCCKKIWIPPADPVLECDIDPVTILADNDNQRYSPMPFELKVNIRNRGGKKTDSVYATITVPKELELAGDDAPDNHTKIVDPGILLPNGSGTVNWQLKHPVTITEKEYQIQVWVKTSNADSSLCQTKITIPALDAPSLQASCFVPAELIYDESAGKYLPDPFQVTLRVANVGKMTAENVSAFLYLPEDVILAPGEQLRKDLGTLPEFRPGDTPAELTWDLIYTENHRFDQHLQFKWAVGGISPPPTSIPTDSAEAYCETFVEGLEPFFECAIELPDSLTLNATKSDVVPNPFTLKYTITNTSSQTAAIKYLRLAFNQGDGIELAPSTPDARVDINKTLAPGESHVQMWEFNVTNRLTYRRIQLRVDAVDDEDNPITCIEWMGISALSTALVCSTSPGTDRVRYNVVEQEYEPLTWVVTSEFLNAGPVDLTNVTAQIELNDPYGLVEFDPNYLPPDGNENPKSIPILFKGQQKPLSWGFRLKDENLTSTAQPVEFQVTYYSDQTPRIERACNTIVMVDPVVTPSLICELDGPDTVYFNEDRFEPSPFHLAVRVQNIGTGVAHNVKAYVLQDERFNIENGTSSIIALGSIPAGSEIDFGDNDWFHLIVNSSDTCGVDSVSVLVVADGIPPAICKLPVFVECETRPVFDIVCEANPDTLLWNDTAKDYAPNPFTVRTTVKNTGSAPASDCKIVFVGPARFTPVGQVSEQHIGDLGIGETHIIDWTMRALPRTSGGMDAMYFQVTGKGGLGNLTRAAECASDIYVPPAKAATYEVTCSAPPELIFDDMTGRYIPDPFSFRVTVTNTGESVGRNLELSVRLHQRLTLEGGSNLRAIPSLAPGESITVEFLVRPVAKVVAAIADLCASVVDENGNNADCCTELRVAAATTAFLDLGCSSSVDSLIADTQRGGYENAPFDVTVTVTNNGERLATNVTARLTAYGNNDLLVLPPIVQPVADQLASGESMTVSWQVNAVPLAIGGDRELRILVSGDDLPQTDCILSVYVPAVGTPVLDCNVLFMPGSLDDGVLHFDMDTGDFEGRRSPNGNYSVFDLRTVIYNIGDARANDVAVTVLPPDGVTLDEPNARKDATPGDIQIGASGEATFRFRPVRLPVDMMRSFRVQVSSRNATAVYCVDSILVQGADRVATLRLPGDRVGQYGDKLYVPVFISPTIAAKVRTYRINVQFDPDIVQFYGATNEDALTQHGWNGPRHTMLGSGLVRVEDLTTGSPLATREEGVLVYLIFEAVYGDAEQEMNYAQSALSFIAEATVDGNSMLTTLNSFHDDKHGDIALNLEDGMVTVSGECIVPLQGGAGFALEQNQPNPFNPVTRISYTLATDTRAKLTVYDALGREVRRLVDEQQAAGQYTVLFDASGLPSGTYIYKLETLHNAETKRMVLTR